MSLRISAPERPARSTGSGYDGEPSTSLGARLRELRQSRGWRQSYLAHRLSTGGGRVSDWELGFHEPQLNTLRLYAAVFDMTLSELLDGVS